MPSTIKQTIEEIVRERPGIGPGEIAGIIGRDKSNVRVAAKELVRERRLTAQSKGQGYAFFPVGIREGCASACASAPPDRSRRTGQTTSIPARNCDNMPS